MGVLGGVIMNDLVMDGGEIMKMRYGNLSPICQANISSTLI